MNNMLRPITLTSNSNFISDAANGNDTVGQGWKDLCKQFVTDAQEKDEFKKCANTNRLCKTDSDTDTCVPDDNYGTDAKDDCQKLDWLTSETYTQAAALSKCKFQSAYSCADANGGTDDIKVGNCNPSICTWGFNPANKHLDQCVSSDDSCDRSFTWALNVGVALNGEPDNPIILCSSTSKRLGKNCVYKEVSDGSTGIYPKCTSSARSLFGSAAGLTLLAIYSVL